MKGFLLFISSATLLLAPLCFGGGLSCPSKKNPCASSSVAKLLNAAEEISQRLKPEEGIFYKGFMSSPEGSKFNIKALSGKSKKGFEHDWIELSGKPKKFGDYEILEGNSSSITVCKDGMKIKIFLNGEKVAQGGGQNLNESSNNESSTGESRHGPEILIKRTYAEGFVTYVEESYFHISREGERLIAKQGQDFLNEMNFNDVKSDELIVGSSVSPKSVFESIKGHLDEPSDGSIPPRLEKSDLDQAEGIWSYNIPGSKTKIIGNEPIMSERALVTVTALKMKDGSIWVTDGKHVLSIIPPEK